MKKQTNGSYKVNRSKPMKTITVTQEYIRMLINLLKVDGKDSKDVVRHKLESLLK